MFEAFVSLTIAEIYVTTAVAIVIVTAVGAAGEASRWGFREISRWRFGELLRRVLEVVRSRVWEVWIDSRRALVANGSRVGGVAEEPGDFIGLLHVVCVVEEEVRGGRAGYYLRAHRSLADAAL